MLPRVIQDENTFPYVLGTSNHQKQFPVSGRLLLCTACKWWPRTAVRCHPKSLLCRAWRVRINAINCRLSVMGKAMKQGPKQELATLQIISPQLIVSSDQKAMAVFWPARPLMWDGGRLCPEASVWCRRVKTSVSETDPAACLSYLLLLHKDLDENVLLDVTWGILALARD